MEFLLNDIASDSIKYGRYYGESIPHIVYINISGSPGGEVISRKGGVIFIQGWRSQKNASLGVFSLESTNFDLTRQVSMEHPGFFFETTGFLYTLRGSLRE
jgi:hypothetical protein